MWIGQASVFVLWQCLTVALCHNTTVLSQCLLLWRILKLCSYVQLTGHMNAAQSTNIANLGVFPRTWLVFLWICVFFLKTWALLVFGLVLIEICLFFGLAFCRFLFLRLLFNQILWHFRCFNLLLKADWACFCENLFILGLLFRICLLAFLFNFLADLSFCGIFVPTYVELVFRLNCLFLAWFANYLLVFAK